MSRPEIVWAGLVLVAVGGCFNDSFLSLSHNSAKYTRVVDGSPSLVETVLQEGFSNVGITMMRKVKGSEIRLAGQTKSGDVFCVYIRPGKEASAKKSMVKVHWDRTPDDQLWGSIVEWLAAFSQPVDTSSKES